MTRAPAASLGKAKINKPPEPFQTQYELKIVFCCAKPWPASNANAAAQPSAPKRTDIKTLRDMRDPAARTYKDTALTPVGDDEEMTLNLLTDTTGAPAAVMHLKKIARLTAAPRVV
jgi:hypothetical protein